MKMEVSKDSNIFNSNKVQWSPASHNVIFGKLTNAGKSQASQNYGLLVGSQGADPIMKPAQTIIDVGKMMLQAAKDGDLIKLRELIVRGVPFISDWLGTTALHFAAMNNHLEICEILLRGGINKDARTKVDRTPLHFATYNGHDAIVALLLSKNCDVDAVDMLKMTALHWAIEKKHKNIVHLLLQHGADPTIISKFGKTATTLAFQSGQDEFLDDLKQAEMNKIRSKELVRRSNENFGDEMEQIKSETNDAVNSIEQSSNLKNNSTENRNKKGGPSTPNYLQNITDSPTSPNIIDSNDDSNMDDEELPSFVEPIVQLQNLEEPKELDHSALELLKNHGISMLPTDDTENTVLTSALQSGRKLVLSEGGKLLLNGTKFGNFPTKNMSLNDKDSNNHLTSTKLVGAQQIIHRIPMGNKKAPLLVRSKTATTGGAVGIKTPNKNIKVITMDMFKQMYGKNIISSIRKISDNGLATPVKTTSTTSSNNSSNISKIAKIPTFLDINKMKKENNLTAVGKVEHNQQSQGVTLKEFMHVMRKRTATSAATPNNESNLDTAATTEDELPPNIIEVCSDDEDYDIELLDSNVQKMQPIIQRLQSPTVNNSSTVRNNHMPDSSVQKQKVFIQSGNMRKLTNPMTDSEKNVQKFIPGTSTTIAKNIRTIKPSVVLFDIPEICRQLSELKKQTEEIQKQLDISQKQNEDYRIRLERLEGKSCPEDKISSNDVE